MKILVVDDEQDICEILQYNLETEGYEVDTANSAEEALGMIFGSVDEDADENASVHYDLILLDVMMGKMSGFQMARRLRDNKETALIPIIFITALDSEDDIVKGLNIGADDYIPKPLSIKEVKARVAAVLRRSASRKSTNNDDVDDKNAPVEPLRIVFESLIVNMENKTMTIDGENVPLTKIEFELISLLVRKKGKVFSREELLRRCWPADTYVLDRTVDVNITRLRKKIGRYGKLIKTRFGYGYTFQG